ncbi:hypothetical protein [uncultured Sphingomonas sp.]|uniref:hypothetical protein n=1 Tax=uncultured Sphingomonas sp. TaxID=158754 RepID=UPI0035CB7262
MIAVCDEVADLSDGVAMARVVAQPQEQPVDVIVPALAPQQPLHPQTEVGREPLGDLSRCHRRHMASVPADCKSEQHS